MVPSSTATPCSGEGECLYDEATGLAFCNCPPDRYGEDCSGLCLKGENNQVCDGRGICDPNNGACECLDGTYGSICQYDCPGGVNNPCNQNGICDPISGVCVCDGAHWGGACVYTCPGQMEEAAACSDHGDCDDVSGHCKCFQGWEGEDCSLQTSSTNTGTFNKTALLAVLGALLALCLLSFGCAYYKRRPLVDWMLWKLGGFRFTRFKDAGSPDEDLGADGTEMTSKHGSTQKKRGKILTSSYPASDEFEVAHSDTATDLPAYVPPPTSAPVVMHAAGGGGASSQDQNQSETIVGLALENDKQDV